MKKYKTLRFCKDGKGGVTPCYECKYYTYDQCPMQLLGIINKMIDEPKKTERR